MKQNATIKRAQSIRSKQKEDYQRIFRQEVKRKGVSSKNAAINAGSKYRGKYGNTATERWLNALEDAKRSISKAIKTGKAAAKKSSAKKSVSKTVRKPARKKTTSRKSGQLSMNFKGI